MPRLSAPRSGLAEWIPAVNGSSQPGFGEMSRVRPVLACPQYGSVHQFVLQLAMASPLRVSSVSGSGYGGFGG